MIDFVPLVAVEGSGGLGALGTVFTQIASWVGEMVNVIVATPLLLLPVGIFAFGAVIGLSQRFIGR